MFCCACVTRGMGWREAGPGRERSSMVFLAMSYRTERLGGLREEFGEVSSFVRFLGDKFMGPSSSHGNLQYRY